MYNIILLCPIPAVFVTGEESKGREAWDKEE